MTIRLQIAKWNLFCELGGKGKIFFAVLMSIIAANLHAQDQGEIEKVEIEIVKSKQITLPKAERNFEKVSPRPVEPIKPEIKYELANVPFRSPEYNPAIRPLKLKAEPINKIFSNYISGGYGNYASPYLEGYITNKRDRNKFFGAKLFHHSYGSGPVDAGNSASGSTQLKVFARGFGQKLVGGGFLSFENWNNKFYGQLPDVFIGDAASQSYSTFSLGADIGSKSTSKLNYRLSGGFSYLKDNFNSSENEQTLNFESGYQFGRSGKFVFNADYSLITRKFEPQPARSRHLFKIQPAYQFSPIQNLVLSVGVNTAFQNDTLGTVKSLNIYPNIQASYELSSAIQAYASLAGDMDKVSLQKFARENSWIDQNVLLNHTNRTIEFLGGFKIKMLRKIAFNGGVSTANFKNLYFYQNLIGRGERFAVVYDQGNTQRFNLFGEFSLSGSDKVKAILRGDYFAYSTDKVLEAWHRPTYRVSFISSYNIYNKILLDVDFILQGGMKALAVEPPFPSVLKTVTISPAADLNVKASYVVSSQFSVFVKANNILDNQYQVYLYYPVRGFQAMAGLTWSF